MSWVWKSGVCMLGACSVLSACMVRGCFILARRGCAWVVRLFR